VNISRSIHRLPGALNQTVSTLRKADRLSLVMRPALNALRPPFRQLDTANHQIIPFAKEATPIIRKQIRPFTRVARPYFRDIGRASNKLSKANPEVRSLTKGLNRFFNVGAFNKNGAEGLTGNLTKDRARSEGYLYWLGWAAQNTVSLFSTADANGPFRRGYANGLGCADLKGGIHSSLDPVVVAIPALAPVRDNLLASIDQLGLSGVCQ
jgi:phospholipid/cholesterol/gamma-HCH transport system substrate-binding protein